MNKLLGLFLGLIVVGCQSADKQKEVSAADAPKLLRPDVRKLWVPPEIQEDGRVFVDGHYKYILLKGSVWSR